MKTANIGDIIVLENGLRLRLELDCNQFKTYDIEENNDCTTGYDLSELKDFYVGYKIYGRGIEEYEIVEIIKSNKCEPKLLQNYSNEELLNELNRRLQSE